ncbi:MAG: hypothetical protein KGL39_35370 [Patescibacteria group bacterium]|nr:hypothetical protein [Patescibacteria group bacterium]
MKPTKEEIAKQCTCGIRPHPQPGCPMTAQPPPEIKSAEDYAQELQQVTLTNKSYGKHLQMTKQRDIAIWNAAIEKASRLCYSTHVRATTPDMIEFNSGVKQTRYKIEQAILNLKRKE